MIYYLEDDDSIRELVIYTLSHSNLQAKGFSNSADFWKAMEEKKPSLLLLDIMLPGEDGLQILKKLRADHQTKRLPVMMITAKGTEYDKVYGLDLGADDYMTKPFGMMELVARVKAMLRRLDDQPDAQKNYSLGLLSVYPSRHEVKVGSENITLTYKEFELLCLLLKHQGMVLSRDQILSQIWGYDFDGENRTVDVHIRTLRHKLGPAGDYIETVRGVGYKIGEPTA